MVLILVILVPVYADIPESPRLLEITTDEELNQYIDNLTVKNKEAISGQKGERFEADTFSVNLPVLAGNEMKAAAPSAVQESARINTVSDSRGGATEYTTTNIQVGGVDEADFVKNDGKFIYIVNGNTLSIVQAYPPQTAAVVSRLSIPGTVSELFLAGDRLVVFTNRYDYADTLEKNRIYGQVQGDRTSAILYDISDRSHPEQIREISAPGRYQNARMIGNYVYFLSAENGYYYEPRIPVIFDGSQEMKVTSVWCPPHPVSSLRMNTLTSFPTVGGSAPEALSFLLGWDNTLYVSPTDVFVAYQKDRYGWYGPYIEEDTLVPGRSSVPDQESVINRFAIRQGEITYKATGIVPGYLLNQFSLDQYDGNLRVATTVQDYATSGGQYSNVYVLNPDLKIIGRLEHLAPGEKIYSARFMGDVLYLVTFKQTDPLFVIDLSNPNQPGILGELKIPGYSDYLHPFDRTHLIGIGKDTYENSGGGVVPTGVKIALFDISDLNNPRIVDSRVIGEKGSDSAVLTDHRAFLLDTAKNIMVLPIKEVLHTPVVGSRYEGSYSRNVWQGAYVFGVGHSGFTGLGKVEHGSGSDDASWWSGSTVRRSIFMDTVLYTISQNSILGSDLKNLADRVMKIDLVSTPEDPWYMRPLLSVLGE
jgi:uncharacterized secreted protein with C-terminal beta-propeller domain